MGGFQITFVTSRTRIIWSGCFSQSVSQMKIVPSRIITTIKMVKIVSLMKKVQKDEEDFADEAEDNAYTESS